MARCSLKCIAHPNSVTDRGNMASAIGRPISIRPEGLEDQRLAALSAIAPPRGAETKSPTPSAMLRVVLRVRVFETVEAVVFNGR